MRLLSLIAALPVLVVPLNAANITYIYSYDVVLNIPRNPIYFAITMTKDFLPVDAPNVFTRFSNCSNADYPHITCNSASLTQISSGVNFVLNYTNLDGTQAVVTETFGGAALNQFGTFMNTGLTDTVSATMYIGRHEASPEPSTLSLLAVPIAGVLFFVKGRKA
jgi:hypothetical protein